MDGECSGIVVKADRVARRISALTPGGMWHFSHPSPSRGQPTRSARVFAAALNPLCHSHFIFTSRERGWGWLKGAQLIEILWPSQSHSDGEMTGDQRGALLAQLRVGARLRGLILSSQQPAGDCPLLFQLLLVSLRQLVRGAPAAAVLAAFAVKLLLHEGLWSLPMQCARCDSAIERRGIAIDASGVYCDNCTAHARGTDFPFKFTLEEVELIQAVGVNRDWPTLNALPIGEDLAERIAAVVELLVREGGSM